MTKQAAGMPGVDPSRRWWKSTTGRILSLGALAAAIGAILALWPGILALLPKPDPEDSARFTAVRITSQVPLSEYRQRSVVVMAPQGSGQGLGGQRDRKASEPIAEPLRTAGSESPTLAIAFAVAH